MIDSSAPAKVIERHHVTSESDVMSVVLAVYTIAQQLGYSAAFVSELATSVSELATNIVKYAGEGEVSIHQV